MKKSILLFSAMTIVLLFASCGVNKKVAQGGYPPYYQQPYTPYPNQTPTQAPQQTGRKPNSNVNHLTGPAGKVTEWQAGGWEIAGNNGLFTMYDVTKAVYDKLLNNRDKYILVSGVGGHKTSLDAAHQAALLDAIMHYSVAAGTQLKGRVEREFATFTDLDKLIAAYSGVIEKNLSSYMNEEIAVKRKTEKGYELEAWFTLDEGKLKLLRQQAMEQAIEETAIEETVGNAIRDNVNSPVNGNLEM